MISVWPETFEINEFLAKYIFIIFSNLDCSPLALIALWRVLCNPFCFNRLAKFIFRSAYNIMRSVLALHPLVQVRI